MKIGFIGQGWIGKNFADDFEKRGYDTVRYSLETPYNENKEKISECDIVLIAVPTPTTPEGFNISIVRSVLSLIGKGKVAVIKSTIIPGTTVKLQQEFSNIYVFHNPEFLVEKSASYDASHPNRNIIGVPNRNDDTLEKAKLVLSVLPKSPYETIMDAHDAEFVKYAGNCFLYTKVIFINILFDLVTQMGGNWQQIREALIHDPRIGVSHTEPIHSSGRGAGGHCFIKDLEAFRNMYDAYMTDSAGSVFLKALAYKNIQLLADGNKDIDLLQGVYGNLNAYRVWKPLSETDL